MQNKQVVVTGVGPVTAIGVGAEDFFRSLSEGRDGIREITLFDVSQHKSRKSAYIPNFNVEPYLRSRKTYLDRSSEFALAGLNLAIQNAGLDVETLKQSNAGLFFGNAFGCVETARLFYADVLTKGPRFAKPILFPHTYPNTTISLIAIEYGLDGFHDNFASGMVSSGYAIMEAFDLIREGRLKLALVGGCEALSELVFTGYESCGMLSPGSGGVEHCVPFDIKRNGFILGEGAGMIVLEEEEHARARNAMIYAELRVVSSATVSHMSDKENSRIIMALEQMINESQINPKEVNLYLANANGSVTLDRAEAIAVSKVLPDISVSTIKPMIGEIPGADTVLQVIAAVNSIQTGIIPSILHLEKAEIDANYVISSDNLQKPETVLTCTIDPAGSIVLLALKAYNP